MKFRNLTYRFLPLMAICLMLSAYAQAQTYMQIGNGSESSSMPYTSWAYSWSKALYKSNNLGEAKTITSLAIEAGSAYTLNNQEIYVKHTTNDQLSGGYEDTASADYTLVYQGNADFSAGWNEISLNQPYDYNGTDNLVIYWVNEHGESVYADFKATTTSDEVIKVQGGDSQFPESDGFTAYPQALPNMRFYYQSSGPATPSQPAPANNSIKVAVDTELSFELGENTTHYHLLLGPDTANLDTLVNQQAISHAGTYTYSFNQLLQGDTTYYWQIVAINDTAGASQVSPLWNFTTEGIIDSYPWHEGFEEVWYGYNGDTLSSIINTNYPDSTYWEWTELSWNLEKNSKYVHSGQYGARCYGGYEGTYYLKTPRINLPENMSASFWWKNAPRDKAKGTPNKAYFQVSNDGGATWNTLDTLAPDTAMETWKNALENLNAYAGNDVHLRWKYEVTQTASNYVFLDDIRIESTPEGAVIDLAETDHQFPELCKGGEMNYHLVAYNTGTQPLEISGTDVTGDFACSYAGTIPAGKKDTITISFIPASNGQHSGSVTFLSNATSGQSEISLTGTAIAPAQTFFQDFDNSDSLPENWYAINSPEGYTSGGGVDIVSFSGDAYSDPNAAKILMANDSINPLLLVTPGVTNHTENQLTWYAKKASQYTDVEMQIGVMDNPYNAKSFIPKKTVSLDTVFTKDTLTFKPSTDEPYIAFKHNGNPTGSDNYTSLRIDDIAWEEGEPVKPLAAENVFPEDDTTDIDVMHPLSLKWNAGSGNTEGYIVYFGTDTTNWQIAGDTIPASETSYALPGQLDFNTTFYWKIVPYNEVGNAENVKTWAFTTMEDPLISSLPWTNNFDDYNNDDGYTIPKGWSHQDLNDDNVSWDLWSDNAETGTDYAYSSPNAMHIAFTFNPKDDYLFTPPMMLDTNKQYKLSFRWMTPMDQVTGQVYTERLDITLGTDNSDTAMTQLLFRDSINEDEYRKVSLKFIPETSGRQFLGFYAWSDGMQYLLMLDNVALQVANTAPEFTSTPDTLAAKGQAYTYNIAVSDAEDDSVAITADSLPAWLNFTDNGDGTATLAGTPETSGTYTVILSAADSVFHIQQEFTIETGNAPEFNILADTTIQINEGFTYQISCNSSETTLMADTLPDWLSFADNGDETATLEGTPTTTGTFDVVLTATNKYGTATGQFTITVESASGLNNQQSELRVWPNPAHNKLNISTTGSKASAAYMLKLSHLNGKVLLRRTMKGKRKTIDVSRLASGIYLLTIETPEGKVTRKIILQ